MNMRTSSPLKYYLVICNSSDCPEDEEDHWENPSGGGGM